MQQYQNTLIYAQFTGSKIHGYGVYWGRPVVSFWSCKLAKCLVIYGQKALWVSYSQLDVLYTCLRDLQIAMHKDLETEVAIPIRLNRYTERKTICRVDGDRKNKKKNCIK